MEFQPFRQLGSSNAADIQFDCYRALFGDFHMSRALLLNTAVFNADNAVRRNSATYNMNYASGSDSFVDLSVTVPPMSSREFVAPVPAVAVTVLRTNRPVTCTFRLRDNVTNLDLPVSKFLVVDFDFLKMTITSGTDQAYVELHQT